MQIIFEHCFLRSTVLKVWKNISDLQFNKLFLLVFLLNNMNIFLKFTNNQVNQLMKYPNMVQLSTIYIQIQYNQFYLLIF